MKVLFISYNGATESLIKSQGIPYLKGLSKKGVGCVLMSFEKPPKDILKYKKKIHELKQELDNHGIKWYRLGYHKWPSLPATVFDIFLGIALGVFVVISKKIDIIHGRATVPAAMAYAIARLTGRKFVYDERGLTAEEYIDGGMWKKNALSYRLTLYFEKKFLKNADGLIVLTQNIKDYLTDSNYLSITGQVKKDIDVIPCCVDTERFNKNGMSTEGLRKKYNLSGKFIFLYTGSLGTWYLLDEMIDFFMAAKNVVGNAHFLILTHADKEFVRRSCKDRGLSFGDVTIDQAEFEDMPNYIKLGDIGMFFIKPVLSKRSSCPTKFAEYLACGLPVIINSGIGDTDTIVEENKLGSVVNYFHNESYLDALNKSLKLLREKDMLSDRCNKIAKDLFSLESGVSKYFDVYNKVLS